MKKLVLFSLLSIFVLNLSVSGRNFENRNSFNGNENFQVLGRVFWRGMVDKKVHLIIQDLSLKRNTVEGTEYPEGVWSFTAALPSRGVSVGVNKTQGRGSAQVIQQPSRSNDFTAIVEIVDEKGGAKEYQVEVYWQ